MIDLRCGDCLKLMRDIPDESIDLVLCDPPYGISFRSNFRKIKYKRILNDSAPFLDFIPLCDKVLKPTGALFIFSRWDVQQVFINCINSCPDLKVKSLIVWDKGNHSAGDLFSSYGRRYETIIFACKKKFRFPGRRPVDIKFYKRVSPNSVGHPTPKPVALLADLILDTTIDGATVLDNCMGSGSTGVACVNTNRNFIGFELDKDYFNLARNRILSAYESKNS